MNALPWCACGHTIHLHRIDRDFACPTCESSGGPCAERLVRPPGWEDQPGFIPDWAWDRARADIEQYGLSEAVRRVREGKL